MSQTLLIANEKQAYTLTDMGTFLFLKDKLQLVILIESDKDLMNIYTAIAVNPEKFSSVNKEGAKAFIEFLISKEAQTLIKNFGVKQFGKPLFIPDRLK
jgi:tungstate transport system substrate-binding protein